MKRYSHEKSSNTGVNQQILPLSGPIVQSVHNFFPKYVVTPMFVQCDARTPQHSQTFHDHTNPNCITFNRNLIVVYYLVEVISTSVKYYP